MNPPAATALDYPDIQGNLLHGYRSEHVSHMFLGVVDPADGRALLARLGDQLTTAVPLPKNERADTALNIAVTFSGLAALGVGPNLLAGFPEEFREPMRIRARRLDDTGPSGTGRWEQGLGTGASHLLLMLNATSVELLEQRRRELLALIAAQAGLELLYEQRGDALEGSREHFGFADGFSQPQVKELQDPGQAPIDPFDHRAPLPAGEFLLGYPDSDGQVCGEPLPELVRNGTYMVWRKLRQDVALFRTMLARAAAGYGDQELLAAKIVGRWRDGVPLIL